MRTSPLLALLFAGCTLSSEVTVTPLVLLPGQVEKGNGLPSLVEKGHYLRAIERKGEIDRKTRASASDLLALGTAEMAAGRVDDARRHLRLAFEQDPFRTTAAQIAWTLSQLELLVNNFAASFDWAQVARGHGLIIRQWHMDYLSALSAIPTYRAAGAAQDRLPLSASRPDLPRVTVRLNGQQSLQAVIDSGAVLSIMSNRLAAELPVRSLGAFRGTFFGLLGEPIEVGFGIIDRLELGEVVVEAIPVAIMPDDKMNFMVRGKRQFKIDLLLGASFLKEFRIDLDFPAGSATFTRLTSRDRRPVETQNLFFDDLRPAVRSAVNGRGWYLFILDTGSEVTFLNESHLAALPIQQVAPRSHNATLQGLGGSKKRGGRIDDVVIGLDRWAGIFRTLPMYGSPEPQRTAGIIGENFLKNFRVVIDFGRMRVDLIRPRRIVPRDPSASAPSSSPPFPPDGAGPILR
ncbi:MAG TPA: retropepsin-like aspartic protease [Thermoanaerobaculia bacterium]|nr:retropepsin-like aspartic protease [Thermoanaerobaculia bacterium]